MGILRQPTGDLFGLLVPEHQILGAAMTASTQAGPMPGGFVRTSSAISALALVSSGTLDRTLTDLDVRTLQAGGIERATFRWSYDQENYRSWDPPVAISGFEFLDRSTVASKWIRPHVARIPASGLAVAVAIKDTDTVVCWRQTQTTNARGIWDDVDIEDTGNNTVACIVPLASGRLAALYTYQVAAASTTIRMSYSDDGGATWALGSSACLDTPLGKASTAYKRIRAAELNGQIAVFLWEQDTTDTIYQFLSTDGGASLAEVETFSVADKACPDVAVSRGVLYVATIEDGGAASLPWMRVLSSASMPLSSAEAITVTGSDDWAVVSGAILDSAECALLADDDGALWIFGTDFGGANETIQRVSFDGGATWAENGGGTKLFTGDGTSYLRDIAVAPERGRAILLCRSVANASADDSLMAIFAGGWSSVGLPQDDTHTLTASEVAGWAHAWVPIDEPQFVGGGVYAETLTGAATSTLASGGLTLAAAGGENAYYTATPDTTGAPADGVLAEWHVLVASGTVVHQVTISDGAANSYIARATVTTTTITLRDMIAGADIGLPMTIDATKGIALRIAIDKGSGAWGGAIGRVRCWVRQDGPHAGGAINFGPRPDRLWEQVESSTTLAPGGSPASSILWGAVATAANATYSFAAFSGGSDVFGNILDSPAGQPRGRVLTSAASPLHLAGGLRVHGVGGPTMAGDTWRHSVAYEHPVEAIDVSRHPSPRKTHRSTTDATAHDITWSGIDLGWRTGDPLGIIITGANFGTASLYRDNAGANKVLDLDLRVTGLGFTRSRGQLLPGVGAAVPWQLSEGALKGAHIDFGGGVVRKVRTNHAGTWQASGAPGGYPSSRVELDAYDSGDPASGTVSLWMPGGLFIVETLQTTDTLMLRIPAQTTAEGYFELGTILIGRMRILQRYAKGRSVQISPMYELTTSPSGARFGRALGPARRAVEFAYDDNLNTTGIHETAGVAPDWMTLGYTGADAVASPADTPRTLSGIFADTDGGRLPIGYAPAIRPFSVATSAAAPYRDLDPNGWMYGRAVSKSVRFDAFTGNEQRDELVRGSGWRIEEEL